MITAGKSSRLQQKNGIVDGGAYGIGVGFPRAPVRADLYAATYRVVSVMKFLLLSRAHVIFLARVTRGVYV